MMSFKASFVLLLFLLALVLSNAAETPSDLYWKTELGNIRMPKVLKDCLQLGSKDSQDAPATQDHKINSALPIIDDRECMNHYTSTNYTPQIPSDGRVIYFTHEKLFISGTKMKLHFRQFDNGVKFLPLQVAKTMSKIESNKLQTILNMLSINPNSNAAQFIQKTIKECQEKGVKDEVRFCSSSLEDMAHEVKSSLDSEKNKLMVVATEEDKDVVMEYKIQKAKKLGNDDNHTMVCHKLPNPYAVFLCHNIKSTNVYSVSLVGANNMEPTNAIAICHKDTSSWDPAHLSFRILKIKPGSETICHFVSGDTVVWIRN